MSLNIKKNNHFYFHYTGQCVIVSTSWLKTGGFCCSKVLLPVWPYSGA